ncbi:putative effector 5 [Venturia nashicola]|uniref:Putative effector 5 n=1 Tax=Venturia nashicola TaxID=86259 RepID=A0A4Z1PCT6_9PEZI|nr:putative effector 5 [Venturia nashicola]TLD35751.1 putative effector 5 [Venturia nashicola]
MQFTTAFALAALSIGQAAAGTLNHRHFHMRSAAHAPIQEVEKRDVLTTEATSLITKLGMKLGANAAVNNGAVWLGDDGDYTNEFINNSTEDVVVAVWGPAGSWVNAIKPLITVSLPADTTRTVSFANGASGAWAAIYPDTTLTQYGQIGQTWGEFTFSGKWSTVDVSREVSMSGRGMRIETPKCVSDMETCVFVCNSGETCLTGYSLKNCEAGSQPGAQIGEYGGAASGGCSGMGDKADLKTYFY